MFDGKRAAKILRWAMSVPLFALILTQATCQDGATHRAADPVALSTASARRWPATAPTSVRVCVQMEIQRRFGVLAHLTGKRNSLVCDSAYDPDKSWWDNPMIVYEDAAIVNPDVTAGADTESFRGRGESPNANVELRLVPHADVALKTPARSDAMQGTITVTITAVSSYYDGGWTEIVRVEDKPLVFHFDTRDASQPLEAVGTQSEAVSSFAFERYVRDHQKWEPKAAWPAKPKNGDWQTTISGKDAKLELTTYRRAPSPRPAPARQQTERTSPAFPQLGIQEKGNPLLPHTGVIGAQP